MKNIKIADREDSLQKIAFMPEKERDIFVRGLLKKLQKEKGIIESNERNGVPSSPRNNLLDVTTGSLFTGESQKGEWYFDNPSLRAQGTTAFKNKWGKRPNSDNWRRNSALNSMIKSGIPVPDENLKTIELDSTILQTDLSMEGLLENLPLSEEKLALSNQKKFAAYKQLGLIYKNKLGVCKESIFWNEKLIAESPGDPDLEQILFDLSFCQMNHTSTNVPIHLFHSSE